MLSLICNNLWDCEIWTRRIQRNSFSYLAQIYCVIVSEFRKLNSYIVLWHLYNTFCKLSSKLKAFSFHFCLIHIWKLTRVIIKSRIHFRKFKTKLILKFNIVVLFLPLLLLLLLLSCFSSDRLCATPMDSSPLGSSVPGILQARILEWVAISFSRGSSWPRNRNQVSRIIGRHFNLN